MRIVFQFILDFSDGQTTGKLSSAFHQLERYSFCRNVHNSLEFILFFTVHNFYSALASTWLDQADPSPNLQYISQTLTISYCTASQFQPSICFLLCIEFCCLVLDHRRFFYLLVRGGEMLGSSWHRLFTVNQKFIASFQFIRLQVYQVI